LESSRNKFNSDTWTIINVAMVYEAVSALERKLKSGFTHKLFGREVDLLAKLCKVCQIQIWKIICQSVSFTSEFVKRRVGCRREELAGNYVDAAPWEATMGLICTKTEQDRALRKYFRVCASTRVSLF
jgi:hypothetical protein